MCGDFEIFFSFQNKHSYQEVRQIEFEWKQSCKVGHAMVAHALSVSSLPALLRCVAQARQLAPFSVAAGLPHIAELVWTGRWRWEDTNSQQNFSNFPAQQSKKKRRKSFCFLINTKHHTDLKIWFLWYIPPATLDPLGPQLDQGWAPPFRDSRVRQLSWPHMIRSQTSTEEEAAVTRIMSVIPLLGWEASVGYRPRLPPNPPLNPNPNVLWAVEVFQATLQCQQWWLQCRLP